MQGNPDRVFAGLARSDSVTTDAPTPTYAVGVESILVDVVRAGIGTRLAHE